MKKKNKSLLAWDSIAYKFYDIPTARIEEYFAEVKFLKQKCHSLETILSKERQKNKELQEQLNEFLEEMREC